MHDQPTGVSSNILSVGSNTLSSLIALQTLACKNFWVFLNFTCTGWSEKARPIVEIVMSSLSLFLFTILFPELSAYQNHVIIVDYRIVRFYLMVQLKGALIILLLLDSNLMHEHLVHVRNALDLS